jgi:hypothetical protein
MLIIVIFIFINFFWLRLWMADAPPPRPDGFRTSVGYAERCRDASLALAEGLT